MMFAQMGLHVISQKHLLLVCSICPQGARTFIGGIQAASFLSNKTQDYHQCANAVVFVETGVL